MQALFDSNILIDYLNGFQQAAVEISRYNRKCISIVTWVEVMAGTDATDEDDTRLELLRYTCLPLTSAIAECAFRLRRDRRFKLPDALIFATAQTEGLLLVTRNSRDFSPADPQIRIPYTI